MQRQPESEPFPETSIARRELLLRMYARQVRMLAEEGWFDEMPQPEVVPMRASA